MPTSSPKSQRTGADSSSRRLTRLAELRALAESNPDQAQRQAWRWIAELGRAEDRQALAELFGQGVAESPKTMTTGMPVGPMRNMPRTRIINGVLAVDSPWTGKTFHADGSGGFNRTKLYSAPVVALLTRSLPHRWGMELTGFPFNTTIKPGVVEPVIDVLSIEYDAPEHHNPALLRRVRDELVRILPGTYLGRATYRQASGDYVLVGYFALRCATEGVR